MDDTITRRDFLSLTVGDKTLRGEKPPENDIYFKKYANSRMPFSDLRTTSTLAAYAGTWTNKEKLHLLRRTTFGLTLNAINILNTASGVVDAVNILLNVQYPATSPLNVYQADYNDTQGCPFGASWVDFSAPDNSDANLNFYRTEDSFKPWWIGQMINQQTDLLEKITLFWSNHFGARTIDFNDPKAIWQHYKTIRTNALGNFRTLIKAITIDPHMLNVLNGNLNSAAAPDENYARELQELFTVGKGPGSGYNEEDVKQAAKVLTGWRREVNSDGSFSTYFQSTQHDISDKQFSSFYGNTLITGRQGDDGQYETDALIDMILQTDECAKYICRCLYRWFVYYVIDDAEEQNVIAPLAKIFRDNNYEIKPVLFALFTSEHFFDPLNRGCIIKSPVDLYIGFNREFNIQPPPGDASVTYKFWRYFKDRCNEIGQNIADPVNISGWPAYRQEPVFYEIWINSSNIQLRALNFNYYTGSGVTLSNLGNSLLKIDSIQFVEMFENPGDPNQVVEDFITYLLPAELSQQQKDTMKSLLLNNPDVQNTPDYYWTNAWRAYFVDSGNSMLELVVRQRLDKLIDYITSLEEYQLY